MNILILPDWGRSFNAVRPEAEIYISLARAGHKVIVMSDPEGAYADRYREQATHFIPLKPGKKIEWHAIRKIREIIKQESIDVVYASKSRTIPNAAFAAIGTGVKVVAYRGTTGGMNYSDVTNYLSIMNPRIDGIICVSNAVKRHVQSRTRKGIRSFVQTIYKGHQLDWYDKPPVDLNSLGGNPDKFNVLCVGSPRPPKGMKYMLRAAGYLKDLDELNIILVGNGFEGAGYQDSIKATGMGEGFIQPGFRNDVPQIAAACDVMVLPSLREGLPRSVLESLASGTPVITSANEGAMEIIEDGVNGYVVPLKDGQAIAEKIRYLYQNRDKLQALKDNCKPTISEKFSHEKTVEQYIQYFESITARQD